jgi:hypothetical protein
MQPKQHTDRVSANLHFSGTVLRIDCGKFKQTPKTKPLLGHSSQNTHT